MNLADNLKKIRKDNNLSQEQLAEKLGVSRQAVSKWESRISYPEMDKVIQICNLFNLNINELINEDIKDVAEHKEAIIRNNKYINSFFEYITKTIDMFSSMRFKQKVKCLFEQCFVATILFIILLVIGLIGSHLVWSILSLLPDFIYYPIYNILQVLYTVVAIIVGCAVLLHIFKTRYLDYYEIVKEDIVEIATEEERSSAERKSEVVIDNHIENDKHNKIFLEKKKDKIVIRDPKHSEYKFITGLGKILLWFIKFMACLILGCFAVTMIGLVMCLPISFLFFKNSILFVGLILAVLGGILLNSVILEIIYSFIVSKKWNKTRIFVVSLGSILLFGIGLGMACVSATEFDIVKKEYDVVDNKYSFTMSDDLTLNDWGYYDSEIEYIEKDIKNIEVVVKHSDMYYSNVWKNGQVLELYIYSDDSKIFKYLRSIIDDINHKKIASYDKQVDIYVYGNKANLDKLKKNSKTYDSTIKSLEKNLEEAYLDRDNVIAEKNRLVGLMEKAYSERNDAFAEKNRVIDVITNSGFEVVLDEYGEIIAIKIPDNEEIE